MMQHPVGERRAQVRERVGMSDVHEATVVAGGPDAAALEPFGRHQPGRERGERLVLLIAGDLGVGRDHGGVGSIAGERLQECPEPGAAGVQDAIFAARIVVAVAKRAVFTGVAPSPARPTRRGGG